MRREGLRNISIRTSRRGKCKFCNPLADRLLIKSSARCTSAAPMYFEPFHLTDMVCIDGGVSQNNPLESAYLEVKKIWGEHVVFDSLLSIGTGHAKRPVKHPDSDSISDDWLKAATENFMASMDGEAAWSKFCGGLNKDMKGKANRLNIRFKDPIEPALDDTTAVSSMALEAEDFPFNHAKPAYLDHRLNWCS